MSANERQFVPKAATHSSQLGEVRAGTGGKSECEWSATEAEKSGQQTLAIRIAAPLESKDGYEWATL
jgi:hypothetical protein